MNRSDKQKEIISDSDTTGNKNEPCPENETPCSEEPVQEKEDNKSVKETKVDKSNPDNENDSHASENGLIGKVFSSKTIKGMVGKEVTWAAIAAIGGAAIVIWNIIRYTFLLFSSYIMHIWTRVPIYLLMMRKNTSFTDGYIFYVTIIVLFLIANPVKYASLKSRVFLYIISTIIVMGAVMCLVLSSLLSSTVNPGLSIFRPETYFITNNYQTDYKTGLFLRYLCLLFMPFDAIHLLLSVEIRKTLKSDEPVVSEEHISKSNKKFKRKLLIKLFEITSDSSSASYYANIAFRAFVSLLLFAMMLLCAALPMEGLLDQDGRYIVADLGEQYIVQTASYEQEKYELALDNSRYYVIDSNKETVEVIRFTPPLLSESNYKK